MEYRIKKWNGEYTEWFEFHNRTTIQMCSTDLGIETRRIKNFTEVSGVITFELID